jgi:uncharacterized protein
MKRIFIPGVLWILTLFSCTPPHSYPEDINRDDILWIATWNVENFSLNSSGLEKEEMKNKLDQIASLLAHDLQGPDIIALQEVMDDSGTVNDGITVGSKNFTALAEALEKKSGQPYRYYSLPPKDGQDGGKPGANIRVGYLYNEERVKPMGEGERWDDQAFYSCRKPLVLSFLFNDRIIHLINVHLSSRIGGDRSKGLRKKQAAFLAERITTLQRKEKKSLILLMGDMNDTPDSATLNNLSGGSYGLIPLNETPTYTYKSKEYQLDHMLASSALEKNLVRTGVLTYRGSTPFPSDHFPLMCGFYLPRTEARVFSTISLTPTEGEAERSDSIAPTIKSFCSWPIWPQR